MREKKLGFRSGTAKIKAVFRDFKRRRADEHVSTPIRRPMHIALAASILIGAISIGLPALIQQYASQQARIPQSLADQGQLSSAPAADAVTPTGKAQSLTPAQKDQLDADYRTAKQGRARDTRPVQTLDEGRTEHRAYRTTANPVQ